MAKALKNQSLTLRDKRQQEFADIWLKEKHGILNLCPRFGKIYTTINALDRNSQMWKEIEKYVANTHGPTHSYKLEIVDIFEVEQAGKKQKFEGPGSF